MRSFDAGLMLAESGRCKKHGASVELLTCMQPQRQVRYKQDRLLGHPVPVSSYPWTTASALRMLVPALQFFFPEWLSLNPRSQFNQMDI